jgi:hypothetical protein
MARLAGSATARTPVDGAVFAIDSGQKFYLTSDVSYVVQGDRFNRTLTGKFGEIRARVLARCSILSRPEERRI